MDEFDLRMYDEIMASKLFSDEEKEIFRSRFEKQVERNSIYDKLNLPDLLPEQLRSILNEIIEIDGDRCEHDRSLMGTCSSCDELDEKTAKIQASLLNEFVK